MELNATEKKRFRSIGHKLKPVIIIGDKGLSEAVHAELERALEDHELIKVKINNPDPALRKAMTTDICQSHRASLVQAIGKVALILRPAQKPNPKLSNLLRPV